MPFGTLRLVVRAARSRGAISPVPGYTGPTAAHTALRRPRASALNATFGLFLLSHQASSSEDTHGCVRYNRDLVLSEGPIMSGPILRDIALHSSIDPSPFSAG
eukprot:413465-Hanusia_phi.AAC.1